MPRRFKLKKRRSRKYGKRRSESKLRGFRSVMAKRARRVTLGPGQFSSARAFLTPTNPFPDRKRCTLVYTENVVLTSVTLLTAGNEYLFNTNSVYDPNNTGSGHQPMFFDQLNLLYKKYRVFGVSIQVTFYNPTTTTMWCAILPHNSQDAGSATNQTPDTLYERPGVNWTIMPKYGDQAVTMQQSWKVWELEGMTYLQWLADGGFDANVNANPAALQKFGIVAGDMAAPSAQSSITAMVRIAYDVEFYAPQTQTQS